MKTKSIIIVLTLTLGLLTSCDHDTIRASDEVSTLEYSIPDYSTLRISDEFHAYITFSDTEESILIEANENLHDRILVQKEGNALKIALKKFTSVRGNATMNVYIVTKDIKSFDLDGASKVLLENVWNVQNANLELSGACDFIGEVAADRINLDMGGASSLDIYGNVNYLDAELSGSSDIRDFDLSVEDLQLDMSGASDAFITVNESIDIEASGASTLNYKGAAVVIHKDLSGASEIVKID